MINRRAFVAGIVGSVSAVGVLWGQWLHPNLKVDLDVEDGLLDTGFHRVPIDRLRLAPNTIVGSSGDYLQCMANDMQVMKHNDGEYLIVVNREGEIIDGSRHVYCATKLGWTTIMCHVVDSREAGLQRWRDAFHIPTILEKTVWRDKWIAA